MRLHWRFLFTPHSHASQWVIDIAGRALLMPWRQRGSRQPPLQMPPATAPALSERATLIAISPPLILRQIAVAAASWAVEEFLSGWHYFSPLRQLRQRGLRRYASLPLAAGAMLILASLLLRFIGWVRILILSLKYASFCRQPAATSHYAEPFSAVFDWNSRAMIRHADDYWLCRHIFIATIFILLDIPDISLIIDTLLIIRYWADIAFSHFARPNPPRLCPHAAFSSPGLLS